MATDALRHLTAAGADREARLADLRRMRVIATSLLALMAAIFLATSATRLDWPWLDYLRAFAEAGMVGACADWFAVVALFRHPLGIAIASPLFHEQAKTLWAQIERGVYADPDGQAEAMARACETGLRTLGHWLSQDRERRARLNRWIRLLILRTVLPRRTEIGAYVAQVVHNSDSATLVDRLELQVGKDLQYIRINGTLVGGLVGLVIFIVSRWIAVL